MRNFSPLLFCSLFAIFVSTPYHVWAEDDDNLFRFEEISLRGTGCPAGSAAVVTSPDAQTISVLFDRFGSNVPQENGQNDNDSVSDENPRHERRDNHQLDHKLCLISFMAKIPVQHQIEALEIGYDFRGYTYAERGTYASFKSSLIEKRGLGAENNGQKNVLVNKVWNARQERQPYLEENWTLANSESIKINSRCARREERKLKIGLQNILLAKIFPRFQGEAQLPVANITLDSTDLKGRLVFKFKLKSCGRPTR